MNIFDMLTQASISSKHFSTEFAIMLVLLVIILNMDTLFRKRAFLVDENAYSSLHVENDCSRLLNQNMEQFFE